VSIFESVNSANKVYEETHTVTVNNFGFLQFEIGSGNFVSGSYAGGLTPSLIVKTYVVDGETERIIDTKRMSEIIYNANVSRYSHTVGLNPDPALTGASVISQIQIDANGVLTTTNRDLTPEDIAAAPAVHRHDNATAGTLETPGVDGYMSATDKAKLDGVAAGAEENVNADWDAIDGDAQILNKPTTIAGYGITDAASKTELADGLALKVDKVEGERLMTAAEITKLADIEEGATNYQHPATHPATMIEQDETHRFVTDTEKANWNAGTSLNRGYIFIGDAQNKPLATLGAEGEVLMSNGVYNNFGKVKDANIASDAAISGTKITPDFGLESVITGSVLMVNEINVLPYGQYNGTINAEGNITGANIIADGGDVEAVNGIFTGDIIANSLNSDNNIEASTNIEAGGDIIAGGNISGVNGTFSGDVSGARVLSQVMLAV
ncbi:MAG: hypothetical protein JXM68_07245, partial [Sedimentisphaerales bacterium]|nr:hypothetical protein [Sedimentisphaerales bacterium]